MGNFFATMKKACLLACVVSVAACSSNGEQHAAPVVISSSSFERIDERCVSQVLDTQQALQSANAGQYHSLANTAEHCIAGIDFPPRHPDIQTAMQFNALSVVNYVKAGDMAAAEKGLASFTTRFPQRDLLFDDFTSFIDTATALLSQHKLDDYQLSMLNINPSLRDEIKRTRRWSLN